MSFAKPRVSVSQVESGVWGGDEVLFRRLLLEGRNIGEIGALAIVCVDSTPGIIEVRFDGASNLRRYEHNLYWNGGSEVISKDRSVARIARAGWSIASRTFHNGYRATPNDAMPWPIPVSEHGPVASRQHILLNQSADKPSFDIGSESTGYDPLASAYPEEFNTGSLL